MKNMNLKVVALLVSGGVFVGAGCVSTGKYKKLMDENAALQSQLASEQKVSEELGKSLEEVAMEKEDLEVEKEELIKQSQASMSRYDELVGSLAKEVQEGQLKVTQYKNMLTVDVAEQIFFNSGSATLKKSGQEVLLKLADALKQYDDKIIRVVGHTDNVPVGIKAQAIFPTNWELSVLRATNVVRFLEEKGGIDPKLMIASGRGEHFPIAENDTSEGRRKNRRIEIMLLDRSMVEALSKTAEEEAQ